MRAIKLFSKAAVLFTIAVLGASGIRAETITQHNGVTTVRGVDDAETAAQRQLSRGRSGVVVFRGASRVVEPAPEAAEATLPQRVTGGRNLWIYEPASQQVTACSLRRNIYGERVVRCSSFGRY